MKKGLCPDMPFYPADWLSSAEVTMMTPAGRGGFIDLLSHAWSDPDCCLPADDESLAVLSRLGPAWPDCAKRIRACLVPDPERPGFVFNQKQRSVRREQQARIEANRLVKRSAAKTRWERERQRRGEGGQTDAHALQPHSSSNADAVQEPMQNDASSPVSPLPLAGYREHPAPSLEEVKAYAATIGLAEWKATDWFQEMEGIGWIDYKSRPIVKWQAVLDRVKTKWEADGRPATPPKARTARASSGEAGKPFAPTTQQQINATQQLLDDVTRQISKGGIPNRALLGDSEYDAACKKYNALREEKARLKARKEELLKLQAEGK